MTMRPSGPGFDTPQWPVVANRLHFDTTPVVTMRELNQRTSAVMDEINDRGCPTLVTRRGRFVALITPLENHSVESIVLSTDPALQALLPTGGEPVDNAADLSIDEFRRRVGSEKANE